MMRRLVTTIAIAAVGLAATADAQAARRADLVVPSGSVHVANGKLTGSFTVSNAGRRRAGRSSAALTVKASGKRRTVKRFRLRALRRSKSRTVNVSVKVPGGLPAGSLPLRVCADAGGKVRERSESNNCRRVGKLVRSAASTSAPPPDPIPFEKDTVFSLDTDQSNYWIYVPDSYDSSNTKPITLFVWMHGCGGEGSGDIYTISPGGDQSWISVALGGREDDCWDPNQDQPKLLAAIASVKSHFNIDPHRVIVGGYSSGGDLAYRTAFYNADMFAGLLAENTSPFRDTGSSQQDSLAAASWKFHVVHLAHTEDETYPIDGVRKETDAMKAAGFPIKRIERPGTHYDADSGDTGTDHDLRTILLPHLNDPWRSP
jgi:dienelactone hydrolase